MLEMWVQGRRAAMLRGVIRSAASLCGASVLIGLAVPGSAHAAVPASGGQLSVIAGGGNNKPSTTPQTATGVQLYDPFGVAVDSNGDVYIADTTNDLVEKVTSGGQLSVIAGGGGNGPSTTPQTATSVRLNGPTGVAVDSAGNVYIADNNNGVVEKVTPGGQLSVIAGGGTSAPATTPQTATNLKLENPQAVAVGSSGSLYIADYGNGLVEKLSSGGQLSVIAGGGTSAPTTTPQNATNVGLKGPTGVAVDSSGNVYIADHLNNLVEEVSGGQLSVIAGAGTNAPSTTPQTATGVGLGYPIGVAVDSSGNVYIADEYNNLIEKVTSGGQLSVIAGGGTSAPTTTPQSATTVELNIPGGVAVDSKGNVYIADTFNSDVEKVTVSKAVPTLTWAAPAAITYGTALSSTQLDATATGVGGATLPGTFTYTPGSGTVLAAGANQTLSVTFTPADSADYTSASATVRLTVNKAPTTLTASALIELGPGILVGHISGTLLRSDTGMPVASKTVAFTAGSTVLCSATTNTSGVATCQFSLTNTIVALLALGYQATFDGDANYLPSTGAATPLSFGVL